MRRRRRRSRSTRPPYRASNPTIPWLHGLAAMGDERWGEAIKSFQRFLEMAQPQDLQLAYFNLGACYLALEQYDKALAALDEVQRRFPGDPETPYSRGVIYACAGRILEAIATFESFARRWPRQARQREVRKTILDEARMTRCRFLS